ncbi:MAG: hypothetical protein OFPII_00750 [Osedax symbiont Rs1]|nr:MAG: hypothetical protein OFPII_00750 [Osedax symbiont Rs1]
MQRSASVTSVVNKSLKDWSYPRERRDNRERFKPATATH